MANPKPQDKKHSRMNHWYRFPHRVRCLACNTILTCTDDSYYAVTAEHGHECYHNLRDKSYWKGFESAE